MTPIRSMIPAAFLTAALVACSPFAGAQQMGRYGPNVDPYAGSGGAFVPYGQGGFDQAFPAQGFADEGLPGDHASMDAQSRPYRKSRSYRKPSAKLQAREGVRRDAISAETVYDRPGLGKIPREIKDRISYSGGQAPFLDPVIPRLDPDAPRLGMDAPRLEAGVPRLGVETPQLGAGVPQLNAGVPYLNAGVPYLNTGVPYLNAGVPYLNSGVPYLNAGVPQLGAGVPQLNAGVPQLGAGVPTLNTAVPVLPLPRMGR